MLEDSCVDTQKSFISTCCSVVLVTISHFDDMLRLWRERKVYCYMKLHISEYLFPMKEVFLSISPAYVPIVERCIQ